jgi:DNA-binding SARP family transcriptional activator
MDAIVELYLLGPVQIKYQGEPLSGFESRKALALLCYLAEQKKPVSRTQLTHLFWGDKAEQRGRSNLSRVLHNNAALLPNCFDISRDTVEFKPTSTTFVDVHFFMEVTQRPQLPALLEAAVSYRGSFMADILLKECPEFDAWLAIEQELWRQRIATVLHRLISHYRNSGDYEQGLTFSERLLSQDPWREEAHREMMLMLALSGQRTAALAQYEKCCDILIEELGVNPSAETTALYYRIRNGEIQNKNNLPIINYLPQIAPQIQSALPNTPSTTLIKENNGNGTPYPYFPIHEEPAALSDKRTASDFDQILARLANPVCRMLTIVGPNNAVQKRLLAAVTNSLTKVFSDGVYSVTTNNSGQRSLPADIAYALNLTESDFLWDEGERAHIWLFRQLREKKLLLVISNVDVYRDTLLLIEEILKRAPLVKVLISAQAPLQLSSEWIFEIY